MIVPDCILPIVAHRIWRWDLGGLSSLNGERWIPGKPLVAACRAFRPGVSASHAEESFGANHAPAKDCTCGVYAAKSLSHLHRSGYDRYGIHGEVDLWGFVVEHEMGWRAQYAYPRNFVLPVELTPTSMASFGARMAKLTAYGCDISLAMKQKVVPLWSTVSGYSTLGFDLLIQHSQKWYLRRINKQQLQRGDRVAILGQGIAVIEQVRGNHVYAMLWNRSLLRMARKEIVWNQHNFRWEARPASVAS